MTWWPCVSVEKILWTMVYCGFIAKIYRIMAILKVETDIIANISSSPMGRAVIFVIMFVEARITDIIVFISDVMCMRVTNWPNIFVDQGQFRGSDFISDTHQRENVQFKDNSVYFLSFIFSIFERFRKIWEDGKGWGVKFNLETTFWSNLNTCTVENIIVSQSRVSIILLLKCHKLFN